ncbi:MULTISPECIES: nuclear transport factor 2 family protein [Streptacidiphilus]|uniref:Nuclear transport factor 2 family protein n=1 Tax=Streptacidiphilus cavernicola TaxID=3342716 RepID=A0ABV6UK21_9ACTN|nr:nuclear transport factor 2 family protein [Streptacidiphilus jeojiense]
MTPSPTQAVAERLREAFEAKDLALLGPLLDPKVRWGGPEETEQTCHSRGDVLAWYGRAQAAGMSAQVTETVVLDSAVVLALAMSGPALGPNAKRPDTVFQVFHLAGGLVVDIRGFQHRRRAVAFAEKPLRARG